MSLEGSINIFDADNNYWLKLIGFFIGIIVLGITCFIDDSKGIPSWAKLIAQVVAAIIVAACGIKIENINFDKVNQILFFNIINNNQSLTLNIKYNLINSKGFDYIKNYKNSKLDKNKFMVFSAIEKLKYFPISVININSVINIFFEN